MPYVDPRSNSAVFAWSVKRENVDSDQHAFYPLGVSPSKPLNLLERPLRRQKERCHDVAIESQLIWANGMSRFRHKLNAVPADHHPRIFRR